MTLIGIYLRDNLGRIIGFRFESGFEFHGDFDKNDRPVWGEIRNEKKQAIYNGQIVGDIHDYLDEYLKTGQIKQRPITF